MTRLATLVVASAVTRHAEASEVARLDDASPASASAGAAGAAQHDDAADPPRHTDNLWGLLGTASAPSRPVGPHLPPAIARLFGPRNTLVSVHASGSAAVLDALGLARAREVRKAQRHGLTLDGVAILSFPEQYVSGHGDGVGLAPAWLRTLHRMPLDAAAVVTPSPRVTDYVAAWEPLLDGTVAAPRACKAESSPLLRHESAALRAVRHGTPSSRQS